MDTISHLPGNSVVIVNSLITYLPYSNDTPKGWIDLVTMIRGLAQVTKKCKITILISADGRGVEKRGGGRDHGLLRRCDEPPLTEKYHH